MKRNIGVKTLGILVIILVCLISFVGIYVKDKNTMTNIMPEYLLSRNLKLGRVVELTVDDSTEEVTYDSEGNVTTDGEDEDGNLKEGYTKKDEKINKDEMLTSENFETVKSIIQKRLDTYGIEDYEIRLNNETGDITLELVEDSNTDNFISILEYAGEFTIKDSETEEVLMDNSDVKKAEVLYSTSTSGTTVYLSIEFTKDGKAKLEEISNTYVKTTDDEGNTETKEITINLDDEELIETYFGETISTGTLDLTIGSASTDSETIQEYIEEAMQVATLIDSGKMPITYTVDSNNDFSTQVNLNVVQIILYVIIAIAIIGLLYLCIRYKLKGILLSISYIGYVAVLLIVLRYTNVTIALESMVGIVVLLIVNYMFIKYLLSKISNKDITKKEAIKQTYIKYSLILVPLMIIAVVFSFIGWTSISSIGMLMFWGLAIMFAYNYIVANVLLSNK